MRSEGGAERLRTVKLLPGTGTGATHQGEGDDGERDGGEAELHFVLSTGLCMGLMGGAATASERWSLVQHNTEETGSGGGARELVRGESQRNLDLLKHQPTPSLRRIFHLTTLHAAPRRSSLATSPLVANTRAKTSRMDVRTLHSFPHTPRWGLLTRCGHPSPRGPNPQESFP